jgi:predicted transposase/invertase (TIGR01784 family)
MNLHDRDNFLRGKKEGISEGIQQGLQQGAYEKAIETAKNMLKNNISIEIIADCTGLPIDTVKTISNNEIS